MNAETCTRCQAAESMLGRWFCAACIKAMDDPQPTRPEQGKPAGHRIGPKLPTFKQQPKIVRIP